MRGLVATGAVLVGLLALVAVATHRGGGSGETRRGASPSTSFLSYAISTYLVVAVAMTALVVIFLFTHRESLEPRLAKRDLRSLVFLVVVIALVTVVASLRLFHPHASQRPRLSTPSHVGATAGQKTGGHAHSTPPLVFKWAPAGALAVLLAAGLAVYVLRRRRQPGLRQPLSVADEVSQVLELALDDLRAERDPRRAIVAAYARMERLLGAHGLPRRPAEAPFEYLSRVLTELEASPAPVFELTRLFERAKFSHHSIDRELKDEAIDALVAVRDELRAA